MKHVQRTAMRHVLMAILFGLVVGGLTLIFFAVMKW